MKIDNIYNDWIDTKALSISEQTLRSYVSAYDKHLLHQFGDRDIDTINFIDYQKFANSLLVSGKKPKTVKNILAVMIQIYKFAIKNDWYDGKNYPKLVELPSYDNKFYVPYDVELQKAYLKAVYNFDELIYRDMFLFLLHGRRLGEVIELEWQFIDLQHGIVYYPPTKNKSRKHRTYRLTDYMVERLRQYHAREIELQGTVFPTGFVFKNPETGTRFADLRKPWQRLLKRFDLPYTKLHSIRHILGTYLINELKFNLLDVSYMLGHSDVSVTMKYYTPSPDIARDCTQAVIDSFRTPIETAAADVNKLAGAGKAIQMLLFDTPASRVSL